MRDYGKVSPRFWIGQTGKKIRAAGCEAQIVGLYLLTSPHANMLGLFYLPKAYIAHEVGCSLEGASKALASLSKVHFCAYDEATEMVWVYEMARFQIGEQLKEDDKRCKGVQKEYDDLPENPFLAEFYEKYKAAFNLVSKRGASKPLRRPIKAPSKPGAGTGAITGAGEDSAEPQRDSPPAACEILAISGESYKVTQAQIDEYAKAYPAVDVPQQFREMRQWAIANPTNRKTLAGMPRFINRWLAREQDKPPPGFQPRNGVNAITESAAIREEKSKQRQQDQAALAQRVAAFVPNRYV